MAKNHLTVVIADVHLHKKLIETMAQAHVSGATVIYGRGSVSGFLLNLLGLDSTRKEILLMVTPIDEVVALHQAFKAKLKFDGKGNGLCFSLPLTRTLGVSYLLGGEERSAKGEKCMHELLITIVDRDKGEDIVEAARKAGATGATILHGRGSGAHKCERFINLEIEPEKEVVLFVLDKTKTEQVISSIQEVVDFSKPNSGILFTTDLSAVNGIREQTYFEEGNENDGQAK